MPVKIPPGFRAAEVQVLMAKVVCVPAQPAWPPVTHAPLGVPGGRSYSRPPSGTTVVRVPASRSYIPMFARSYGIGIGFSVSYLS